MRRYLCGAFSFDPRALALLRIGLGVTIVLDVLDRWSSIAALYTARGALIQPPALIPSWSAFSPYAYAGDVQAMQLLSVVHLAIGMVLVFGWRARFFSFLGWVFTWSLADKNPSIHHGTDHYLMVFLFLGAFLPLGARFSVDRKCRNSNSEAPIFSMGTVALTLQYVAIYLTAAFGKLQDVHWREGTALYYAIRGSPMWAAELVNKVAIFVPAMTYGVLAAQLSVVFLLTPSWRLRAVTYFANLAAHLGIMATLAVGIFPVVSIGALQVLFPFRRLAGERAPRFSWRLTDFVPGIFALVLIAANVERVAPVVLDRDIVRHVDMVLRSWKLPQYWIFYSPIRPTAFWYEAKVRDAGGQVTELEGMGPGSGLGRRAFVRWLYVFENARLKPSYRPAAAQAICAQLGKAAPGEAELVYAERPLRFESVEGETDRTVVLKLPCVSN